MSKKNPPKRVFVRQAVQASGGWLSSGGVAFGCTLCTRYASTLDSTTDASMLMSNLVMMFHSQHASMPNKKAAT